MVKGKERNTKRMEKGKEEIKSDWRRIHKNWEEGKQVLETNLRM